MKKGHKIRLGDQVLKPGDGIRADKLHIVIGKKHKRFTKINQTTNKAFKMKKICFVILSRANYGSIKSVIGMKIIQF